ncbi:MAG: glycosyltransferase family 9 protein [Alphaproteobacteria bacterium]
MTADKQAITLIKNMVNCANIGDLDQACTHAETYIEQIKYPRLSDLRNIGVLFTRANKYALALFVYHWALRLHPNDIQTHYNLAYTHFLFGKLQAGWSYFEWRFKLDSIKKTQAERSLGHFKDRRWLGINTLQDKHLILWAEQGYGDMIMMLRYLPLIKAKGAYIELLLPSNWHALIPLLQNHPHIDRLTLDWSNLDDQHDYHCSLFSLPLALNTDERAIPKPFPIAQDAHQKQQFQASIKAKFGENHKPLIGIVLQGGVHLGKSKERNFSIDAAKALLENLSESYHFVNLQRDPQPQFTELFNQYGVMDGIKIDDFKQLASLIDCCDCVVGVDTAILHLSASMEIDTHMFLYYENDWRWQLKRDDSPWYPALKLYRQPIAGEWMQAITHFLKRSLL